MLSTIQINSKKHNVDLSKPIDISIPLRGDKDNPNAWYLDPPKIEPVVDGGFTGSVSAGASTNFNNIFFNPHAHGTHTECVGHITKVFHSINKTLKQFFFLAELISVTPEKMGDDLVISKKQLETALKDQHPEALVIRTLPNTENKLSKQYSHTNPPYLLEETAIFIREKGIEHLLIDLPSVDKEKDEGKLLAHKTFWDVNGKIRKEATITEFIFVPDQVEDGTYLLNLQIAPFENDASPSKPVLYEVLS
ncbi:cyclase family protein [Galbibacter sp. EGI 63066]|uniref:cyclase family protein n=1 Tax=Galbibacter sp. EGI 63066 TaxID=2993559 RepID=UPI002248D71A|nr:cyclase family protein [Galbibacter sp. EGI 63066]MCX2678800.1 cyclase family protein [Galbibacter sp. EGI 63066]